METERDALRERHLGDVATVEFLGVHDDELRERWELDPSARTAAITVIDETANEFPRHRGSLTAEPYRYGYCASPAIDLHTGWPTIKHDLVTGERQVFDHGPGRAAGEPVFVGKEGRTDEDAGWLVTYVHDLGAGTDVVREARRDGASGVTRC